MIQYDRGRNWYWRVANREEPKNIFSWDAGGYVTDKDKGYKSFLDGGNVPSPILCDGELADVLTKVEAPGDMILAAAPADWGPSLTREEVVSVVSAAGVSLIPGGNANLKAVYETSGPALDDLRDLARYASTFQKLPNDQTEVTIAARDKQVVVNSTDHVLAVSQAVEDYLMRWKAWSRTGGDPPEFGSVTPPAATRRSSAKK